MRYISGKRPAFVAALVVIALGLPGALFTQGDHVDVLSIEDDWAQQNNVVAT